MLASVPTSAIDGAVLLPGAGVGHITLLAPAEEALEKAGGDLAADPGGAQVSAEPLRPIGSGPSFPSPYGQFSLLHFLA